MRQTVVALVLASVLVLSGCTLPGSSTDPTATPALDDVERPPGIEDGRLVDGQALLRAHNASLVAAGFESDFRVNGTSTFKGDVVELKQRQRTLVEAEANEYQFRFEKNVPSTLVDVWANRTIEASRIQSSIAKKYVTGEPNDPRRLAATLTVGTYIGGRNFTVSSVLRENGTALFVLRSNDSSNLGLQIPKNATNVSNYTARLVVDRTGRVHEFVATANYTIQGQPGSMKVHYRLLRIGGIEVTRPEWVSKAFNGSSQPTSTPTADGDG